MAGLKPHGELSGSGTGPLWPLPRARYWPAAGCASPTRDNSKKREALRRILIGRTADTYVLASIGKLGAVCPCKVAGLSEAAGIITDAPPGHPALRRFRERGVPVIEA